MDFSKEKGPALSKKTNAWLIFCQQEEPPQSEYEKKKQTFITRTIWTLLMIALFFSSMAAGHLYLVAIVTVVQVMTFKEVIAIANVPSREKKLRFTKSLNWYFLATTMYFLYGESVIYYFKHIVVVDALLLPFATHHRFISFILYIIGMRRPSNVPDGTSLTSHL
jgi:phosphatidate cytidylyltransferase